MPATLRSVTSATNDGSSASFSVTTPSSGDTAAQTGDVLVAFHSNDYYVLSNLGTPTGGDGTWNAVTAATADGGTNLAHSKVWWSVCTSGGAKTVTFNETGSTDEEKAGVVFILGGANTTTPIDGASSTVDSTNATQVANGISPTSSDAILLAVWTSGGGAAAASYTLSGGSIVEQAEFRVGGISGVIGTESLTASGATGTRTATASTAVPWVASVVGIAAGAVAVVPKPPLVTPPLAVMRAVW